MHFQPERCGEFETLFKQRQAAIQSFEGCRQVVLWNDIHQPEVYYTYSQWESEEHLNAYRFSPFFKETWELTRAMFSQKAEARSMRQIGD
jgi:heme-degrading monooxygenase HmoA